MGDTLGSGIVVFIVLIFFIILLIANIIALGRIINPPTVNGLNVQTNPSPIITPGEAQALLWFNIIMLVIVFILLIYLIYVYATTPAVVTTVTNPPLSAPVVVQTAPVTCQT